MGFVSVIIWYDRIDKKSRGKCGNKWDCDPLLVWVLIGMWECDLDASRDPGDPACCRIELSPVPLWKPAIMRNSVFSWIPAPLWQLPSMLSFTFSLFMPFNLSQTPGRLCIFWIHTESVLQSNQPCQHLLLYYLHRSHCHLNWWSTTKPVNVWRRNI